MNLSKTFNSHLLHPVPVLIFAGEPVEGVPLSPDDGGSECCVDQVLEDDDVMALRVQLHQADVVQEGGGVVQLQVGQQSHRGHCVAGNNFDINWK